MTSPNDWESKVSVLKSRGMLIPRSGVVVHNPEGGVPSGAVPLTPHDLRSLQKQRLKVWLPQEEVWPLKYGSTLLAAVSAMSGYSIMSYSSKFFYITGHRMFLSVFPTAVIPPFILYQVFESYINERVLLNPFPSCPLCYSLKGSLIQGGIGFVYPLVASTFVSLAIAHADRTYPVPYVTDWRRILNCFVGNVQASRRALFVWGSVNVMAGGFVAGRCFETHIEMLSTDKFVYNKMNDNSDC